MKVAKCISASSWQNQEKTLCLLRNFVVLQLWPSKNALLVESGHIQIQHKKKQLVESGHPSCYCFKAQDAFSNGSARL